MRTSNDEFNEINTIFSIRRTLRNCARKKNENNVDLLLHLNVGKTKSAAVECILSIRIR